MITIFENFNETWVQVIDLDNTNGLTEFLRYKIGKVIYKNEMDEITKIRIKSAFSTTMDFAYWILFEFDPDDMDFVDFHFHDEFVKCKEGYVRPYHEDEIVEMNNNKAELEMVIDANKYNL